MPVLKSSVRLWRCRRHRRQPPQETPVASPVKDAQGRSRETARAHWLDFSLRRTSDAPADARSSLRDAQGTLTLSVTHQFYLALLYNNTFCLEHGISSLDL